AAAVLNNGIKDPDPEVRMAVCQTWGRRVASAPKELAAADTALASRGLSDAVAKDTNIDVRLAATKSLGRIKGDTRAVGGLANALKDQDRALQYNAVTSLKEASGQDFGNDVAKWQQYANSVAPPPAQPTAVANRPQKFN